MALTKEETRFVRLKCILLPRMAAIMQSVFRKRWRLHTAKEWQDTLEDGKEFLSTAGSLLTAFSEHEQELITAGNLLLWRFETIIFILREFDFGKGSLSESNKEKLIILEDAKIEIDTCEIPRIELDKFNRLWKTISSILTHFGDDLIKLYVLKFKNIAPYIFNALEMEYETKKKITKEIDELDRKKEFKKIVAKCTQDLTNPVLLPAEISLAYDNRVYAYLRLCEQDLQRSVEMNSAIAAERVSIADISYVLHGHETETARKQRELADLINYLTCLKVKEDEETESGLFNEETESDLADKEQDVEETNIFAVKDRNLTEDEIKLITDKNLELKIEIGFSQANYKYDLRVLIEEAKNSQFAKNLILSILGVLEIFNAELNAGSDFTVLTTDSAVFIPIISKLAERIRVCTFALDFTPNESMLLSKIMEGHLTKYKNRNCKPDRDARVCHIFFTAFPRLELQTFVEESIERYPSELYFRIILSSILNSKGDYLKGVEEVENALEIFPNNVELLFIRAMLIMRFGYDTDKILTAFQDCVNVAPEDYVRVPEAFYGMATCLRRMCESQVDRTVGELVVKFYLEGVEAEKKMLKCFLPYQSSLKSALKIQMKKKPLKDIYKRIRKSYT